MQHNIMRVRHSLFYYLLLLLVVPQVQAYEIHRIDDGLSKHSNGQRLKAARMLL